MNPAGMNPAGTEQAGTEQAGTKPVGMNPVRRAVLIVLGTCLVIGVVQGLVWARVTPGVPFKVLADGRYGALPTTSYYHFLGVAIFALSGMVIGVVLAVALWQARAARGWQVLLALAGGSLGGAGLGWWLGSVTASGVDPATVGASAADSIVVAAPTTGTALVVLAQPALAALVYTVLAAWNGRPDLGRPWVRDGGLAEEIGAGARNPAGPSVFLPPHSPTGVAVDHANE